MGSVPKPFNLPVNHVAISVPDLDAAIAWYSTILGFVLIKPPRVSDRAVTPDAAIFQIYPGDLRRVRIAWLSSGNGVGVELFEFQDPRIQPGNEASFERDYNRGGLFHMAVTVPDVQAMTDRVVASGGRKIGAAVTVFQHRAAYIQDPWGNVVELLECSFEQLMSNRT